MPTITDTLIVEHGFFCAAFDHIERVLPQLGSVQEVRLLSDLVEDLLARHAETEKGLAYAALDHVLEDKGELDRMHHDHKEIDIHFQRVHRARSLGEARLLIAKALAASREHFRQEEKGVFPLLEQVLPAEALTSLGGARLRECATAGR
jgi:hypothetical protein